MDRRVSVVKCADYDGCADAVKRAVSMIGGFEELIKPNMRVLIKPNLVARKNPDTAATTHPVLLREVIDECVRLGADVTVAESPGGAYTPQAVKSVYSGCGITNAVKGSGARLYTECSFTEAEYHEGKTVKSFPIIDPVLNAELIISLPKIKTHSMTSYTGAVKNMFGAVPCTHKAELHFRLDDRKAFCSMLVDLYSLINRVPVLTILDGITAMEGDGPTAGERRDLGILLCGMNAHALDLAACFIIGYGIDDVDTLREARERGFIPESAEELDILGEDIRELRVDDFKKPKSHFNLLRLLNLPPRLNSAVIKMLAARPELNPEKCVGCGECFRDCPPKAITMVDSKPRIDRDKCICCFCCQELCPKQAMGIKRPIANRIMLKLLK